MTLSLFICQRRAFTMAEACRHRGRVPLALVSVEANHATGSRMIAGDTLADMDHLQEDNSNIFCQCLADIVNTLFLPFG